jgi:hypothetical protein
MEMPSSGTGLDYSEVPTSVEEDREIARRVAYLLSHHDLFRCRLDNLAIECCEAQLIVNGKLPSFYLKQVLQTILRDVSGVRRIDNRVNVTSSNGLSSTPRPY